MANSAAATATTTTTNNKKGGAQTWLVFSLIQNLVQTPEA